MSRFALHPQAFHDIDEISEYVAADSVAAASRLRAEIFAAIRGLVPFPQQGHTRSDLTSRPLRFIVVREYLIANAPDEKPLWVVAVLHGRRSPQLFAAS